MNSFSVGTRVRVFCGLVEVLDVPLPGGPGILLICDLFLYKVIAPGGFYNLICSTDACLQVPRGHFFLIYNPE